MQKKQVFGLAVLSIVLAIMWISGSTVMATTDTTGLVTTNSGVLYPLVMTTTATDNMPAYIKTAGTEAWFLGDSTSFVIGNQNYSNTYTLAGRSPAIAAPGDQEDSAPAREIAEVIANDGYFLDLAVAASTRMQL